MRHEHYCSKVRYVFAGIPWEPPPGHLQAHRDLGKEFSAITDEHGRPAQQVSAHFHVQARIAKHKGVQRNFNRPKVAPAKSVSVKSK